MEYGKHAASPGSKLDFHMSLGKMNVQVSIVMETVTKDAEGFATRTDIILASIHAYREGRHGSQKWVNRAAFSEATDLFQFRVIPGLSVTTAHVIRCGDERFEITSVEDVKGRKMYLEVLGKVTEASHG
jgi:head-tail adaptor